MIERGQDIVIVRNERQGILEVLQDAGLQEPLAKQLSADDQHTIEGALADIRDSDANRSEGTVQARVGNNHFVLRKTAFDIVVSALAIAGTAGGLIAAGVAAPILVLPAAGALATLAVAAKRVSDDIRHMNANEMVVYEAVQEVTKNRKLKNLVPSGATVAEVEAVFQTREQAAPPVAALLGEL